MSRGLATAANDQDFLRERKDRKDYSGCPPTPALLLPLPVSLLYTPSVDNSYSKVSFTTFPTRLGAGD